LNEIRKSRALLLLGFAALLLPAAADARPISKPRWVREVLITEYYPAPERWFIGKRIRAPGLRGRHRVDWLYSARGVSMEGDGVGLNGRRYHIDSIGYQGWVNRRGRRTRPRRDGRRWTRGRPFWRALGWRNRRGFVTFPLAAGGWSRGVARHYIRPRGISFARGPSRPLRYYRSLAVDPELIPLRSRIYIPAYRKLPGNGWFRAQDTGGAIIGRHVDVYRRPPATPDDGGRVFRGRRIYVIPPKRRR